MTTRRFDFVSGIETDTAPTNTGAFELPKGTTAQRPSPTSGLFRLNTTTNLFEAYNGSAWSGIGGASPTFSGDVLLQNASGAQPTLSWSEDPDNGTSVVKLKAPAALSGDVTLTWPDNDGDAGQALTTDGNGVMTWSTVATDSLAENNVKVGNSGGTASQVDTDLLGTIIASYSADTATISNATPAVVTQTNHGLITGDKVYFTTTGGLPIGVSANTPYYINKTAADTFNLSATLSDLLAGTYIATSSAGSGTHTLYKGGFSQTARYYRGNYEGSAVPSGYIGQVITATISGNLTLTTSYAAFTGNLVLTPGVWLIMANIAGNYTPGATQGNRGYNSVRIRNAGDTTTYGIEQSFCSSRCQTASQSPNATQTCTLTTTIYQSTSGNYIIQGKKTDTNGTGAATLYAGTPPDDSQFYAIRMA